MDRVDGSQNQTYSDRLMRSTLTQKTCPICGKTIVRICFSEYAYKKDGHFFCSWTCMREYEKGGKLKFEDTSKKKRNMNLTKGG